MNRNKILRKPNIERKSISIRIPMEMSKWLYENNFSPTGILMEACKDLGYKEEKIKKGE